MKVGRAIDVREVLSWSARLLYARPALMLPQLLLVIPTFIVNTSSSLTLLRLVVSIISFVLTLIVGGAYPSMVKTVIEGGQPSLTEALGKSYRRFWTLFAAGILVALIVVAGTIALVVPGIVFATWYVYTIPAIMLEDKGATQGMAASKAFGKDKKLSTFLIFLAALAVVLVLLALDSILSLGSPLLGEFVYAVLSVPYYAWIYIVLAYTYLTYGPPPLPKSTGASESAMPPPNSSQPPVQANASALGSGSFCRFCGSPLQAGAKFCGSCGKPT